MPRKDDLWQTSRPKPPHLRGYRILRSLGIFDAETLREFKAKAELAEQRRLARLKEKRGKPDHTDGSRADGDE